VWPLWVVGLGCGEKQATPPEGSGLAGTVLTVEGEVAAARPAAAARRLSPDAEVFADDSVTAAAGAAVEIALRHNRAQPGIHVWIAATAAGRDGQFLDEPGEDLAPLGVSGALLVFDRVPLGMA
jgi:hypothetical protein